MDLPFGKTQTLTDTLTLMKRTTKICKIIEIKKFY